MRKWFEKAHGAIIWTIAIAFVAGIVIWSLTSYFYSRKSKVEYSLDDTVAYLTKDGTALASDFWIFPWDLEQSYSQALTYYQITEVDPIFEEPMLKTSLLNDLIDTKTVLYYAEVNNIKPEKTEIDSAIEEQVKKVEENEKLLNYVNQKFGGIENYKKSIEPDIIRYLTINKVRKKVAKIDESEMKDYYEENRDDLIVKYDTADVDFVSFSNQASANNFINQALIKGFDQAATDLGLSVQNYPNFRRGIIAQEFEDVIFSSTNTLVGPVPLGSNYFVFKVNSFTSVDTFEKFSLSKGYQEVMSQLQGDRFRAEMEKFKNEENIGSVINSEIYQVWNDVLTNSGTSLLNVYKKLNEMIFDFNTDTVKDDIPSEIKAAFVVLVDKISSDASLVNNDILQDAEKEAKIVLESVYKDYPDSFVAVKKMRESFPDRKDIMYNYYTMLYSKIKPYIEYGMIQNIMNDFIDLYRGFTTLSEATDITLDQKAEVLYNLYEINKMLKDATTASRYLEKLKDATPDYMDFDAAFNELEFMKNATSTN
ncbi:hypothetical protein SU69_06980 [Thermosipho melanesiensis]|uniref:PpiC domain-containing protein n=2 Tax=Thermosipho melanesiensis TaxID=46541 RepID=A6LMS5_THEM4|nr:peptidyl-prolyl cis-trans isomerase [Thermosipho melanesiensis]ABR31226.1 hypothetical protein Tmel_1379 [Thermosipho melanesiensis BI429]APT74310.1 hypothetical protein BW47_07305 [Thermosipho melanesiensis]OOC36251.1 hypothetical protein SU68_07050 [Thermosipho melanesiensis]OOC37069.1 hypothetical protein SU69_06980 [Thermosipho melanesiensis]OOC37821.1 hypothetical protein SU70_06990 [Thermosipho melanesiensis]